MLWPSSFRLPAAVLFAGTLFACSLLATDPRMLQYVKPTAKSVMGINVARFMQTPTVQKMMADKNSAGPLQAIQAMSGFDIARDLEEVILVGDMGQTVSQGTKGSPSVPTDGLMILRGKFDKAKLQELFTKTNTKPSNLVGVGEFYQMPGSSATTAQGITFVGDDLALAGSKRELTLAFAASKPGSVALPAPKVAPGKSAKLASLAPAGFLNRAAAFGSEMDLWIVSAEDFNKLTGSAAKMAGGSQAAAPMMMMQDGALDAIQEFAFGVKLQETATALRVEGLTKTAEDATKIVGMMQFLTGLMQMNNKDPKMAEIAPLLQSLKLTSTDRTFRLDLSIPDGFVEKAMRGAVAKQMGGAEPMHSPSQPPQPEQPLKGTISGVEKEQ